jgi:hypothetical protein
VGNRPGYSAAFISLLRNTASWQIATAKYAAIAVPVRLVWGDEDWSRPSEREQDGKAVAGEHAPTANVAEVAAFLASDRAAGITGSMANVTAGLVLT